MENLSIKCVSYLALVSVALAFNAARSKRDVNGLEDSLRNVEDEMQKSLIIENKVELKSHVAPLNTRKKIGNPRRQIRTYRLEAIKEIYKRECAMIEMDKGCSLRRCHQNGDTLYSLGEPILSETTEKSCSQSEDPHSTKWECRCESGRGGICCQFEDVCGKSAKMHSRHVSHAMKTCKEHLNDHGLMWYGDVEKLNHTVNLAVREILKQMSIEIDSTVNMAKVFDMSPFDYAPDVLQSYFGCKAINDPRYRLGRVCYGVGFDKSKGTLTPMIWSNESPLTVFKDEGDEIKEWWTSEYWHQTNRIPDEHIYITN